MARDGKDARVACVQMRLEHLDALARDDRPPNAAQQFLALTAEHHPGDDLDPSAGELKRGHASLRLVATWSPGVAHTVGAIGPLLSLVGCAGDTTLIRAVAERSARTRTVIVAARTLAPGPWPSRPTKAVFRRTARWPIVPRETPLAATTIAPRAIAGRA